LIDGVKIRVLNLDANVWKAHEGLDFDLSVSSRTGEVKTHKPLLSELKGLTFKVIPSVVNPAKPLCYVLGSLTKYKSDGRDNVENLTYSQLCEVVEDLKKYHVDPSVSRLENIEFGLNIDLPFSCDVVLNSIVSMPTKPMTELRVEKTTIGKRCDFQQYEIKIYDKGKAENHKTSSVLRVELRIKKMEFLKKTNIRTLLDLTDHNQLAHAGALLLKSINDVIMFNFDFEKLDDLTPSVREKVLLCTNPKTWKTWTRYQRRIHFKEMEVLQNESKGGNTKALIMQAVYKNWCDLGGGENGFSNEFTNTLKTQYPKIAFNLGLIGFENLDKKENGFHSLDDKNEKKSEAVSLNGFPVSNSVFTNLSIKINGYNDKYKKTTTKKRGVRGENVTITKHKPKLYLGVRVCLSCETDISHKRPQSVFCSKKCKNEITNQSRDRRKSKTPKEPKEPQPKQAKAATTPMRETGATAADVLEALATLAKKMKM
jgi:hypothetical protein